MCSQDVRKKVPLLRKIPGPKRIRRCIRYIRSLFLMKFHPIGYADVLFRQAFGYGINWKHPRDLNEWINYLAFKTDTTLWTELSDKYKVREYVAEKGLSNLLVPLLAIWKNPEEITFDKLPNSFAIKTGCGGH